MHIPATQVDFDKGHTAAGSYLRTSRLAQLPWWPVAGTALGAALVLWYAAPLYLSGPLSSRWHELCWFALFAGVAGGACFVFRRVPLELLAKPLQLRISPVQVLLVVLICLNGLSPYLGVKTTTSFSMYSNLRTEGSSNHLLIPKGAIQLWNEQDDLVEILESTHPELRALAETGARSTFFELRRRYANQRREGPADVPITYLRKGLRHAVPAGGQDVELVREPGWVERKLRHFRDVPPPGVNSCQW